MSIKLKKGLIFNRPNNHSIEKCSEKITKIRIDDIKENKIYYSEYKEYSMSDIGYNNGWYHEKLPLSKDVFLRFIKGWILCLEKEND